MTDYVIRGGAEGKARLRVIDEALGPSTTTLLAAAGISDGMACLDLGCGGGDVTLAMAGMVGPAGRVVGIDMDRIKIALAQQDASNRGVANVEFRTGDATALDANGEYHLVYARLLLTHLRDPAAMLDQMVAAVEPGGAVVVEDLDHSGVFAYPECPALDQFVTIYNNVARLRGGDPEIGPKLPGLLQQAGLEDTQLHMVQPVFLHGEPKQIHLITLENVREAVIATGVATPEVLDMLATELQAFTNDPHTIAAFPRIFQVFGRRPTTTT